jgi:hypothetical protein
VTTPVSPREPWDAGRLEAAFAARASSSTTPTDLVDATFDRVRTAGRPEPAWRRWLPAAAIVLVVIGVATAGITLSAEVGRDRVFREGPTPQLRTFETGEFAFDFPASWLGYAATRVAGSGGAPIAVLGTKPVERRCGGLLGVDINCVYKERLDAGHVRLFVSVSSYRGGTIHDRPDSTTGMTTRTSIGGMPAILDEVAGNPDSYYREDVSLAWEIARPGSDGASVVHLQAMLKEPGVAEGRQQLEALVASFRFTNGPDPSVAPTPEPTPTETPPRLAELRVMTVDELIAARSSPTPEEVIVHGWLARSNVIFDCNVDPNPHPLIAHCEDFALSLSDERVQVDRGAIVPSVPHVVPMLGVDAHSAVPVLPGTAVEVLAVGHLRDHRSATCAIEVRAECERRFVIDRVVPAGQPIDDELPGPWASPSDQPVDGAGNAVEVLRSELDGITVVSIGVADAGPLRSIEPSAENINNGEGAWVIRALVAGDATPVARTFLVGHNGWYTLFEVTEEGLVDRTPPVEGVPTPVPPEDPGASWPPDGVLDVPMPENTVGRAPKAGVVDRTGLLLEARSVEEGDPPRPNRDLQAGEMAVVQSGPDTVIAHWDGTLCDDRFVLTVYGDRQGEPPSQLELRGESADRCRLALVHYGIVLRFSQPVDATTIHGWDRVGTPYEAFPPVHSTVVSLPKGGGGFDIPKVRAALVDLSGRITSVRLPRPDEPRPKDRRDGPGSLVPDPTVAGRYHLMWNGGICTPDIVITIDPTLSNVVVSNPVIGDCDTIGNEYRLILDIDGPVGVPVVEVRYADTSAGAS